MKTGMKALALLGLAMAGSTEAQTYKITKQPEMVGGSYFVGDTGGFNHRFKTPNQRQKRKYARQNPVLRKKWGMKRK